MQAGTELPDKLPAPTGDKDVFVATKKARAALRRRIWIGLLLAFPCALLLSAIPTRTTLIRLGSRGPDNHLFVLGTLHGWPIRAVHHWQLRYGTWGEHFPVTGGSLRSFPGRHGLGWRVLWHRMVLLFIITVVSTVSILTARPLYRMWILRRHLADVTCTVCGYPNRDLPSKRCPECGTLHGTKS